MLHFDWSVNYKESKERVSIWLGLNSLEEVSNWQWSGEPEVLFTSDDAMGIDSMPWIKTQTDYDHKV